MKNFWNRKS